MSKHVLFVCKSCQIKPDQDAAEASSKTDREGTQLLNQLKALYQNWAHQTNLEIREVGCLWTCDQPCAVAFANPHKATYLFTHVLSSEARALLHFGELYLDSKDGSIPWKQLPEVLQSAEIARIPQV